jgi:hypothetical protein
MRDRPSSETFFTYLSNEPSALTAEMPRGPETPVQPGALAPARLSLYLHAMRSNNSACHVHVPHTPALAQAPAPTGGAVHVKTPDTRLSTSTNTCADTQIRTRVHATENGYRYGHEDTKHAQAREPPNVAIDNISTCNSISTYVSASNTCAQRSAAAPAYTCRALRCRNAVSISSNHGGRW